MNAPKPTQALKDSFSTAESDVSDIIILINSYQKEKVERKCQNFDLSEVFDEYDKSKVNLQ